LNIKYSEISAEDNLWQMVEPVLQQDKKNKLVKYCIDVHLKKNYCKCIKLTELVLHN